MGYDWEMKTRCCYCLHHPQLGGSVWSRSGLGYDAGRVHWEVSLQGQQDNLHLRKTERVGEVKAAGQETRVWLSGGTVEAGEEGLGVLKVL